MTIQLPPELEQFVSEQVVSGRYASEADVIREALERLRGKVPSVAATGHGIIGAMRDDAELLEQVTRDIMESRLARSRARTPDE
jgi:putative addiction module CopG family antidote